jgi:signal transduction histidine kinase
MNCADIIKTSYFLFSNEVPQLLYYSHLPALIVSIFVGLWVYIATKKSLEGKIFLAMSLIFSALSFCNLVTWTNSNSQIISIFWFFTIELFNWLMFFLAYFFYVFINHKDLKLFEKILGLIILLISPILLLSRFGISHFDLDSCELVINNKYYIFQLAINIMAILAVVFIFIDDLRASFKTKKIKDFLFFIATLVFSGFFIATWHLSSFFDIFVYEQIGYIGFVIFTATIAYAIVRFKAFNIKLIGAQALVWALVILIGSQFLYMSQMPLSLLIITGGTLIIASVVGMMIVRGVKKEVAQREHIEKIAGELKIANDGQENLIHIMNHQIKGFLGKARYIFAEFLEGDIFGSMPENTISALKEGLRATTDGVNYVTEILRGANASKGTLVFDKKPMDVKAMTEELIPEMEPLAKEWKVALKGFVAPGEYQIIGDRTQLKEAFKNLITNAIRYNDPNYEHKSVDVSLSINNGRVLFSVRDTGKGIAPEDRARLFMPGGVGKNSIKQNADATGFGLSFVKGCVLSHDGIVDYKSNAPEKGTTFFIELPLSQDLKA